MSHGQELKWDHTSYEPTYRKIVEVNSRNLSQFPQIYDDLL